MRAALGDVGKTGEVGRVSLVVHVGLEDVVILVLPRWPVLHVALIVGKARRSRERSTEARQPFAEVRVHHDVWPREGDMFLVSEELRRKQTDISILILPALVGSRAKAFPTDLAWPCS